MMQKILTASVCILLGACTTTRQSSTPPLEPIQIYIDANASQRTAVAAVATADYYTSQLTATIDARNYQATAQAESIYATQVAYQYQATEQAWQSTMTADTINATAIAASTATALSQQAAWTQRAIDITSTADTAAVQAYATQQYNIAQKAELAIERDRLTNKIRAIVPWAGLAILITSSAAILLGQARVRVIQRDARGDAPLLMDVIDGIVYDADRHPLSTGSVSRQAINLLPRISPTEQIQVTARDQMLDMVSRRPAMQSQNRSPIPALANQINTGLLTSNISTLPELKIISEIDAKPLVRDVLPQIYSDVINAEIIDGDVDEVNL